MRLLHPGNYAAAGSRLGGSCTCSMSCICISSHWGESNGKAGSTHHVTILFFLGGPLGSVFSISHCTPVTIARSSKGQRSGCFWASRFEVYGESTVVADRTWSDYIQQYSLIRHQKREQPDSLRYPYHLASISFYTTCSCLFDASCAIFSSMHVVRDFLGEISYLRKWYMEGYSQT